MVGRFSRSNSKDYSQFAKIYNNTESYIPHKCSPRANLIVYSNWNAISCKSLLQPTASLYGEIALMGTFHLWQTLWFSWKRAKRSFLLASAYNMYICTIYVQREREREREREAKRVRASFSSENCSSMNFRFLLVAKSGKWFLVHTGSLSRAE